MKKLLCILLALCLMGGYAAGCNQNNDGTGGGFPSYASAAAIVLFVIVLTITCINLLISKKHVHY